ncbi:hypothetical protein CCM_03820 [Cordyceps militaris CM01]|uniref:Uncharacterized protein n=1 Tax=Cordyceps militaris (strain CM01) TaxID=983644 RepID=G3JGT3_CORMM|nr:uncharacterized protein CCM_03820 [Cordyceps militaris CM01]EGX92447.1 hypothetical protein CCM_03820 [Cordyceps militaris CM01]
MKDSKRRFGEEAEREASPTLIYLVVTFHGRRSFPNNPKEHNGAISITSLFHWEGKYEEDLGTCTSILPSTMNIQHDHPVCVYQAVGQDADTVRKLTDDSAIPLASPFSKLTKV